MKELKLSDSDCIISETDKSGKILYANESFCRFAGYELHELEGKPQSIIRHEDMPKWAFEWLWRTIQNGDVWKGFVKNKTRNGDFYWVFATVYRTYTVDGDIRYTSVRVKPTNEEIAKFEEIYKKTDVSELLQALELKNN